MTKPEGVRHGGESRLQFQREPEVKLGPCFKGVSRRMRSRTPEQLLSILRVSHSSELWLSRTCDLGVQHFSVVILCRAQLNYLVSTILKSHDQPKLQRIKLQLLLDIFTMLRVQHIHKDIAFPNDPPSAKFESESNPARMLSETLSTPSFLLIPPAKLGFQ